MKFLSSRGCSERVNFEDTVIRGLAYDDGLYTPEIIPEIRDLSALK